MRGHGSACDRSEPMTYLHKSGGLVGPSLTPSTRAAPRASGLKRLRCAAAGVVLFVIPASCGQGTSTGADPWTNDLRLIPETRPSGFSDPAVRALEVPYQELILVLEEHAAQGKPSRLTIFAKATTPPETLAALKPKPEQITLAGHDVWLTSAPDGSFEIFAPNVNGCPELRIYGTNGAVPSDAEKVIATGTCREAGRRIGVQTSSPRYCGL